MSLETPRSRTGKQSAVFAQARAQSTAVAPFRLSAYDKEQELPQRQAELFYLQKQIQTRIPMIVVLEDGEQIEGCIEWYDRDALKLRGRTKTMIYKSAIKYMYKAVESGQ
jgi:sRNA-binding regulator protein Hfq